MRGALLGFVAGAALLQQLAALPSWLVLVLLLCTALGGLAAICRMADTRWHGIARLLCGMLAGFAWAGLFAQVYLARALPPQDEGRDIVLVGTIDSLPHHFERGVRFHFAVESVDGETLPPHFPQRVALSWYTGFGAEAAPLPEVRPGERWRLTVRLRRPHGNANPHGFDYEAWLLERRLRATGYVRDTPLGRENVRLDAFVPGIGHAVERARMTLRERIQAALPQHEYAGAIVALVIGDQRAIAQSDWEVFNRTGIGHLISISGLHITMISALVAAIVQGLWRRSFFTRLQLPLFLPAQKAAALAGVCAALLYVLLAGFGVPAQRTLYMLCVVAAALWLGRLASISHVLCLALAVVVLLDPWAVLQPGFWLSFGAVAIILYTTVGRPRAAATGWRFRIEAAARVQWAITLGLVPLTMLLFAQISLVSPLANAIAIPLISLFVTPAALIGSVLPLPVAQVVLGAAHGLVALLAQMLHWMSAWQAAVWGAPVPPWWIFLLALAGMAWLLAPRGWPVRALGFVCLLPLVFGHSEAPQPGELWVTAFDVGQGTAVLLETANRRLLYDTGPAYSPDSNGGNRVVLPYLRGRGIHHLDALIVSHSDSDHAGGAASILDGISVGSVASSLADDHPLAQRAPAHRRCEAGQSWEWDGVRFEMLYPDPAIYASRKWKPNARSCTLKATSGRFAVLLPGDIEAVQEGHLLAAGAAHLRAQVLLAPHHGSGTSSTVSFLQAVQPEIALFQVGRANRYGHPKPEVYRRYEDLGARRLRTDETGAVMLRFGDAIALRTWREVRARYWHAR